VRGWLLGVAVCSLAVLVFASPAGSEDPKSLTVTLTASGPSPTTLTRTAFADAWLSFVNSDSAAHTVVFAVGSCSFTLAPGETAGCHDGGPNRRGTYHYTVDGTFPGTIHVLGVFRSVSLATRTHTIKLGSRVTLLGQVTTGEEGGGLFCATGYGGTMLILARRGLSQPFRRIAMFAPGGRSLSTRPVHNRCNFIWQRKVRPGRTTTYIAKTFGDLCCYTPATSRQVTVHVRP
jgi:hypothetical protein